jgi:hypothetical protein
MQQQMAAERHALEEERKKLRTEWVDRQQKRIKELETYHLALEMELYGALRNKLVKKLP